jgi:anti-sigma regulatory factor (Ser/Thr protein kinase)
VISLEAVPASSGQVRAFVADLTRAWGMEDLTEDVVLCASELATNAILHSRERFVVTARPAGGGFRIDVLDNNPSQLPIVTPDQGSALDLTTLGNSGRGLQIVASLAARWGIFATDEAKTVWAELTNEPTTRMSEPLLALNLTRENQDDLVAICLLNVPVRVAVASGIQVEEVVRDIQLDRQCHAMSPDNLAHLFDLLDRSAPVRLAGRQAALQGAARGLSRFDLDLRASEDALQALGPLSGLLFALGESLSIPVAPIQDQVVEFRAWLNDETARQRAGQYPRPCPLDP